MFAPEDIATIRESVHHVTRDNVVFELGLFIGAIGKERCFILKPRDQEMHLPTDLAGINFADFDANRTDGDVASATNSACTKIKKRSHELKALATNSPSESRAAAINTPNYRMTKVDYEVLASCLQSNTDSPSGLSFASISNSLRNISDGAIRVSAVKLERLNLVNKSINTHEEFDYDFYAYSITEQGIDVLLKGSEKNIDQSLDQFDDDLADDLPF